MLKVDDHTEMVYVVENIIRVPEGSSTIILLCEPDTSARTAKS